MSNMEQLTATGSERLLEAGLPADGRAAEGRADCILRLVSRLAGYLAFFGIWALILYYFVF